MIDQNVEEEEKKREIHDENIRNLYNKLIFAINPKHQS